MLLIQNALPNLNVVLSSYYDSPEQSLLDWIGIFKMQNSESKTEATY